MPVAFGRDLYNDDRMFVLYLCRCFVEDSTDSVVTTIHHESPPPESKWCVVTYRNTATFPAVRVDPFDSLELAQAYLERIEPNTPLVSLHGKSPSAPSSYHRYVQWKTENDFQDYDWHSMYTPGGKNARETMIRPKRQA